MLCLVFLLHSLLSLTSIGLAHATFSNNLVVEKEKVSGYFTKILGEE